MLVRLLLGLVLLSGCHRILPLDEPAARLDDGPTQSFDATSEGPPVDAPAPVDGPPPDISPQVEGSLPPCLVDHFTDPAMNGLTELKGTWSWVPTTEVRQQDINIRDAHAVLAGFAIPSQKSFTANTNVTITNVNPAATAGGAGLGILVAPPTNKTDPHRQVSCLMLHKDGAWYWTMSVCTGSSNSCSTMGELPILGDQLGKKILLILLADGQGKVTCTYKGALPHIVSLDMSSTLSVPPIGVALITFSADARFDRASACD